MYILQAWGTAGGSPEVADPFLELLSTATIGLELPQFKWVGQFSGSLRLPHGECGAKDNIRFLKKGLCFD